MNILIVESPKKCRTINKLLGNGYNVIATWGHFRDLNNNKYFYGIDIDNNFQPHYTIMPTKKKYLNNIENEIRKATTIYLATDDDREGEAISWHLSQILNLKEKTVHRITFTEITKTALQKAIQNPGEINMDLVYSQQARQVLDKLVGFELCPLLWKHISSGLKLSAGRVQSVVCALIIDREDIINKFQTDSVFKLSGLFENKDTLAASTINAINVHANKDLENRLDAEKFLQECLKGTFIITNKEEKQEKRNPQAPFITSTLLQDAYSKLGLTTKQTMKSAQNLYEKGYITYIRTDSKLISVDFQQEIKKFITEEYGNEYLNIKQWSKKVKGSQNAHECIRPTNIKKRTLTITNEITQTDIKLYNIIWKRTLMSQMAAEKVKMILLSISIYVNKEKLDTEFRSSAEITIFPGYSVVNGKKNSVEKENLYHMYDTILKINTELKYLEISATQKYTEPKSRYTEATLIKELEKRGIGRPSTYHSIISKIQEKKYILKKSIPGKEVNIDVLKIESGNNQIQEKREKTRIMAEKNKLFPTDICITVNNFLKTHFKEIMNYDFTSKMEDKLDIIANGNQKWHDIVQEYYDSFHPNVTLLKDSPSTAENSTKENNRKLLGKDPNTGTNIYITLAKYGYCLQVGDDPKKADYYSIGDRNSVTLDKALEIMKFPRKLGKIDNKLVQVKRGPYGFYLEHNKVRISLQDTAFDPEKITLSEAEELLNSRKTNILLEVKNGKETLRVINGKYGPYIKKGKMNIPIKNKSLDEIRQMTDLQINDKITEFLIKKKSSKRIPKKN